MVNNVNMPPGNMGNGGQMMNYQQTKMNNYLGEHFVNNPYLRQSNYSPLNNNYLNHVIIFS